MRFSLETSRDLKDLIKKLSTGLKKLDFGENIQCMQAKVVIEPNVTVTIENKLTFIPSQYIITSQDESGQITRSNNTDHTWTRDKLFLENHGGNTVNLTILFFK